jgi:hypothetical protein
VALVLRSKQGSGKSALLDFFGIMILGIELYLYCQDLENVIGSFNAVAANKLLTVFDEVNSWGGAYKSNNRLKSMITQSQGVLNRKGVDAIQVDDFQNIVFTTNEYWPIKKETNDRRYFAVESSDKMIRNKAYFKALFHELNDVAETPYVFYQYLSSIDISEWDPQDIPQTAWGERLKSHSVSTSVKMIQGLLESGCFHPYRETWVASADIMLTFESFLDSQRIKDDRKLNKIGSLRDVFGSRAGSRSVDGIPATRGWWFPSEPMICQVLTKENMWSEVDWYGKWERSSGHTVDAAGPWMSFMSTNLKIRAAEIERDAKIQDSTRVCTNCHKSHVARGGIEAELPTESPANVVSSS